MAGQPATDVDVRIGARIQARRRTAGLTQRDLADAIGVSAAQFQKYERGVNRISAVALAIVARLTGTPIAAFFDDESDPAAAPPSLEQSKADLLAAAERYFEAKQQARALSGASVTAFFTEAA